MKTIFGAAVVAALLNTAGTAFAAATAWADGYSTLDETTNVAAAAGGGSAGMRAARNDEANGATEEVGAAGGEPGRMSAREREKEAERARAEQIQHDEWVERIWRGP